MFEILKKVNVETIKQAFSKLREKGFFSVFGGTLMVKCISFCSILFLPRIIADTSQYGVLSTVDNFNSYLILVSGLGLANSLLRFCALKETYEEKRAIFQFCLKWGLVINGIIMLCVIVALSFIELEFEGLNFYLLMGVGLPFMSYVFDCISLFLRADMKNKEYARLSVVYTFFYGGMQILLALGFKIFGAIIGRYMALCIAILVGVLMLKGRTELFGVSRIILTGQEKKALITFAIGGLCANSFSIIMPMNEQMMVTLLLADETQVAFYKAASIGPSNLQFLANSIVIFAYPYFAKHSNDFQWIKKKAALTVGAMAALILPVAAFMYVLAPWLIELIFGADYLPAVGLMRVMCIAFAINSIVRVSLGNVMAAIGRIKFNVINAAVTAFVHLILDYLLISYFAIDGAAWALTIAYTFSGLINVAYLMYLSHEAKKGC